MNIGKRLHRGIGPGGPGGGGEKRAGRRLAGQDFLDPAQADRSRGNSARGHPGVGDCGPIIPAERDRHPDQRVMGLTPLRLDEAPGRSGRLPGEPGLGDELVRLEGERVRGVEECFRRDRAR